MRVRTAVSIGQIQIVSATYWKSESTSYSTCIPILHHYSARRDETTVFGIGARECPPSPSMAVNIRLRDGVGWDRMGK